MENGVTISGLSGSSFEAGDIAGRDITINYLVQGVARTTPYTRTIRTFLELYLGTEARPAPFGGRDNLLDALDTWLTSETKPYALVTAGAGQGKSALLVHWTHRLRQRQSHHIVFVPISLRLGFTAAEQVFAVLASRLGDLYHDPIQPQSFSGTQWMDVALSFLDHEPPDKPIVVVLDGLDEAVGWEVNESLLGTTVATGVRVVLSARHTQAIPTPGAWLVKLGLRSHNAHHFIVPPLSRATLPLILTQMGDPLGDLAGRDDLLDELYRFTDQGDPLLIGLYIETLRQRGYTDLSISVAELRQMDAGLRGLYERWLEEQQKQWGNWDKLAEQRVQTLLAALATALGPIDRNTLLQVISETYEISPLTLQTTLATLDRWIVETEVGYVFSHPRLGYFFWEDRKYGLPPATQQQWNAKYVSAGTRLLTELKYHNLDPVIFGTTQYASAYLLEHYSNHLQRAAALGIQTPFERYYDLISYQWARAWESLRGTYDGFLGDVERVWAIATHDPDLVRNITMQFWCALCHSSVVSLSSNIPPNLLAGATKVGIFSKTQTVVFLRQSHDTKAVVQAVALLANLYPNEHEFLGQLLSIGYSITDEEPRANVLSALAPYLPNEVLQAACATEVEWTKAEILSALAPYLPNEVLQAAHAIQYLGHREVVLSALAPYLPNEVLQAAHAIRDIKHDRSRANVLSALAPYLPNEVLQATHVIVWYEEYHANVLHALAPHLPNEVLQAARTIRVERMKAEILSALAPYLPTEEQIPICQEVLETVHTIGNNSSQAKILSTLASLLPIEVLQVARAIKDAKSRTNVFIALAPHLPNEVLQGAHIIRDERMKAEILSALAPYLSNEVLQAAHAIEYEGHRANVFIALAPHLPNEVLEAVRTIADEGSRINVIHTLAPHLPNEVLQVARAIKDEKYRANVLTALAPHLPTEERISIFLEALHAAYAIKDEQYRAGVLSTLASLLPIEEQTPIPQEALQATRAITDEWSQAEILITLAPYLPNEVLQVVHTITDVHRRADVLIALAPYLPNEVLQVVHIITDVHRRADVLIAPSSFDQWKARRDTSVHRMKAERMKAEVKILSALAPYLPNEVLQAAHSITDEQSKARILTTLAPLLPNKVLQVGHTITDEGARTNVLHALGTLLPMEVLQAARAITDEGSQKRILTALAPYLPNEVLQATHTMTDEKYRANLLGLLTPFLPAAVLQAVHAITDEESRTNVLVALAPLLPKEVLQATHAINSEWSQSRILTNLAPLLATEVLQATYAITDVHRRADVLVALAPYLPTEEQTPILQEVLQVAQAMNNDWNRADILIALAPLLPMEVLQAARAITDVHRRADVLVALAPHFPMEEQTPIFLEALQAANTIEYFENRGVVLSNLAPHLPNEVLQAAITIGDEWDRARVLRILVPHLPTEVLQIVRDIANKWSRADVLGVLALRFPIEEQPPIFLEALQAAYAINDEGDRMEMISFLSNPLIDVAEHDQQQSFKMWQNTLAISARYDQQQSLKTWQNTLAISARRPRHEFLRDLEILMPLTLALVDADASVPLPSTTNLTPIQRTTLFTLLEALTLPTVFARTNFLENAGLLPLKNQLHLDAPQADFLHDLLRVVTAAGNAPDGESYLAKFLHYLHDVEWAGHPDPRDFLAEVLGTSPPVSPQRRLALGILEAVQTVCTWWP